MKKFDPLKMIQEIIDLICKCYTPKELEATKVENFGLEDNLEMEYKNHTGKFTEDFEITGKLMQLISETAKKTKKLFKEDRHPWDISERIVQAFKIVFYEVYKMKKAKLEAEKNKEALHS